METENWARVEEIFHKTLALDPRDREQFLLDVCEGRELLRREVTSLIEAFEHNPRIMNEPAFGLGMQVLDKGETVLPNNGKIGNYQIIKKLGSGGMGEVFLADDLKLNRKVALKFLANYFSDDNWAKRRLVREAQAAAILDHPNICAIYGLEAVDEHLYIVMQYVEGITLTEKMKEDSMAGMDSLPIIVQIAEAIAAAHASGIIHRDIKPGNIIVGPDGRVKVLDFGLAKRIENDQQGNADEAHASDVSQTGLILGTVAYMSPEQLRAEELDYRSDVFSLGILIYELVSGKHPFVQPSEAETISSILVTNPPQLEISKLNISPDLGRIVRNCLQKGRDQRYRDGGQLLQDLTNESSFVSLTSMRPKRHIRVIAASVMVLILCFLAFILVSKPRVQTVAVLPFVNESGNSEIDFLADGLAEDLIARASALNGLKTRPFTAVSGYTAAGKEPIQTGQELGADIIVTGNVFKQGDQYVLRTNVIDVHRSLSIGQTETPIGTSNILMLQNDLSNKTLELIQPWWVNWFTDPKVEKAYSTPSNSAAFKLFLLGRHYWKKRDQGNIQLAVQSFQKAIEADPTFAPAHAGLADSYVLLSSVAYGSIPTREVMAKAKAAARQAIEIDPELSDSHSALGVVLLKYDWNWPKAEEEFRRAIELNPEYAPAHYWLSGLLAVTGRADESISEAETAKMLDPFSSLSDLNLARAYYYSGRYDDALGILRSGTRESQAEVKNRYMVALILIQQKMYDDAIAVLRPIFDANKLMGGAALGFAYARNGNRRAALDVLRELEMEGAISHLPPQEKAILYIGLSDNDKAFAYLDQAYKERYAPLISLKVEPLYAGLYSDPRYFELLLKMSLSHRN